ncbi:hypothetical protein A4H97_10675 [Niastella yeongjuensis]|uniref:Uncharacterized protein n=1 Tax=Niastella yeongjuensis TaxID=354355 RepID=A0A1V9EF96_9BACT|nr:hypothetical protein [Niastella yeongjuensis]OQP44817.1 hypothetical protein A4H97_10675 [Niastella yeongjuensis]SEP42221.1 hypothetical protein SAMN05660816_05963 [Niastella yeongjuensis]
MTPNSTKREQLKKDKEKLQQQIDQIEDLIKNQPPKTPVNDMFGRINTLAASILKIDQELSFIDNSSYKQDSSQLQKGFDIISGGGGVNIRPESKELVDQTNELEIKKTPIKEGKIYSAPDPAKKP